MTKTQLLEIINHRIDYIRTKKSYNDIESFSDKTIIVELEGIRRLVEKLNEPNE